MTLRAVISCIAINTLEKYLENEQIIDLEAQISDTTQCNFRNKYISINVRLKSIQAKIRIAITSIWKTKDNSYGDKCNVQFKSCEEYGKHKQYQRHLNNEEREFSGQNDNNGA